MNIEVEIYLREKELGEERIIEYLRRLLFEVARISKRKTDVARWQGSIGLHLLHGAGNNIHIIISYLIGDVEHLRRGKIEEALEDGVVATEKELDRNLIGSDHDLRLI